MSILILTGPAAAGKNTVSNLVSKSRSRCAVIDVDHIRQMYTYPHKAPWEGDEGYKQQLLGVENACLLALNFIKNKIDVILLDVITNDTVSMYKNHFPNAPIVLLMPSFEETFKRFSQRKKI